eukprot:TRINITY_DN6526_c0_g1_i1.p2 TRINITY_DN6526_c0_g1~~TRINITY_DN6526_c0_g1_i1.p2  ORF type:complete len:385 (-),score=240.07 TRINITY_DN6526_c0_g1_i1:117-1229(-)
MSKKGGAQKVSNKTIQKEKAKIIEDKTFGLKNKGKSAKVQKYVATVKTQVTNDGIKKKKEEPVLTKKELDKLKKEELNKIFKPVEQKIAVGVDPKSVLCQYFKNGSCTKGVKCKFSHDLAVGRKVDKIDVYTDIRESKSDKEKDLMETWDDKKLELVVDSKHGVENKNVNTKTEIVCRYFLEAIESKKYGWFWECPNGGEKCMYRHALPPGFVLTNKKVATDEGPIIPVEDIIEQNRKAVVGATPVTLDRFLAWKEAKKLRLEKEKEEEKKKSEVKHGGRGVMSGREMFVFNPELFIDDEEALEEEDLEQENDIDPNVPHNIVTVTGTSISLTRVHAKEEDTESKEEAATESADAAADVADVAADAEQDE